MGFAAGFDGDLEEFCVLLLNFLDVGDFGVGELGGDGFFDGVRRIGGGHAVLLLDEGAVLGDDDGHFPALLAVLDFRGVLAFLKGVFDFLYLRGADLVVGGFLDGCGEAVEIGFFVLGPGEGGMECEGREEGGAGEDGTNFHRERN